jgi:hypothetical protein
MPPTLVAVVLAALVALEDPKPPASAAAPVTVTPAMLAPLDQVARQLAKGGRGHEANELVKLIAALGLPAAEHAKLEAACKQELAKAKSQTDAFPDAAKKVRACARQLAQLLPQMDGEPKTKLAEALVQLDGDQPEAHQALGHVKIGPYWVAPEEQAVRERRLAILETLQAARALEVDDIEEGEVEHPLIASLYDGRKAVFARRGLYNFVSTYSQEKTSRILRQALRGVAMSVYLRRGKLELPVARASSSSTRTYVLLDSNEAYKKAQVDLLAAGQVAEEDKPILDGLGSFTVKDGYTVMSARPEGELEAILVVNFTSIRDGLATAFRAGHLNWISLNMFGVDLPGFVIKVGDSKPVSGTNAPETQRMLKEREEAKLLARAGIAGIRAWMAYLAERGEDPAFGNLLVDQLGLLRGDELLKATSIVEYLQETGEFAGALKSVSSVASGRPAENYASALGIESLGELEARWRKWLLGDRPGLAERIDKQSKHAFDPEGLKLAAYLSDLREKAYAGELEGVRALSLDPDLCAGCTLHAEYLVKNPDQVGKYPDEREEYVDKEGFTLEGALAGANAHVMAGDSTPQEVIDGWLATVHRRMTLLDPGLQRIGYGAAGGLVLVDAGSLTGPYDKAYSIAWPPPNATGIPTAFEPEFPAPVAGVYAAEETLGYPITIQSNMQDAAGRIVEIEMKLYEGSKEVPCHVSTPSKPANPVVLLRNVFALIPKAPLRAKTEYRVHAVWKGGTTEKSWTFKTR